jgi:hypothetical protein
LFFGSTRAPASRSVGRASSASSGLPLRMVNARTCRVGLTIACGGGGESKVATIGAEGVRYLATFGAGATDCAFV